MLFHLLQFPQKGVNIQKRPQLALMKPRNFRALSKNKWFVLILGGSLEKYPKWNLVDNIWLQLWDVCSIWSSSKERIRECQHLWFIKFVKTFQLDKKTLVAQVLWIEPMKYNLFYLKEPKLINEREFYS